MDAYFKTNYDFKSIEDIAEWLENADEGAELSFTEDSREDLEYNNSEPEGWFGIKKVVLFDETIYVFGDYGYGMIDNVNENNIKDEHKNLADWINSVIKNEFGYVKEELCIDKDDWNKYAKEEQELER